MRPRQLLLIASSIAIASIASVAAPAAAGASVTPTAAPLKRAGITVGTARARLVLTSTGYVVDRASVTSFRAPSANRSWRARTTLLVGCTEPGFDPAEDDPEGMRFASLSINSPWRTTRITGTTGTLPVSRSARACPSGLVPGGSARLVLVVQDAAGTRTVGRAALFSAG